MTALSAHELAAHEMAAANALASLAAAAPGARIRPRALGPRALPLSKRRMRLQRPPSALYLNLTPLIDVVFQLLVFFIATTTFAVNEHVLRMDLPPRTAAVATDKPTEGAVKKPETAPTHDPFAYIEDALRIEVQPGGAVRTGSPAATATNAAELRTLLERARRDVTNPAGSLPPTFPIIIAPAERATWQDAVEILNAVAGAGYRNVSFEQVPGEVKP